MVTGIFQTGVEIVNDGSFSERYKKAEVFYTYLKNNEK